MRFVPHNKRENKQIHNPVLLNSPFFPQYSPNLSEYSTTIGLISQPNSKKKFISFFFFNNKKKTVLNG